jgi:hypothetical protein
MGITIVVVDGSGMMVQWLKVTRKTRWLDMAEG